MPATPRPVNRTLRLGIALALCAAIMIPVSGLAQRSRRDVVAQTMPAVVMVLSIKNMGGKLQPVGNGSGSILTSDGAVLTNFHVINDPEANRTFDLFAIGKFTRPDAEPELVCVGQPAAAEINARMDLALIKCSTDLEGRPWRGAGWPTVPIGRSEDLIPGEETIVLGYPSVGGSTIHVTSGKISGWTSEGGGAGRDFIKTDAHISPGNSGGTAINENGELIGVPTAVVVKGIGKVGLIRPIEHARDLIRLAQAGWTPRDGGGAAPAHHTQPARPAQQDGVIIFSRVVDAANGAPIRGAFVVVLRPGVKARDFDVDRVEEQALTFGQSTNTGEFELNGPVPRNGSYTVLVVAEGYQPLIEDDVLRVDDRTPARHDPWGVIKLERR